MSYQKTYLQLESEIKELKVLLDIATQENVALREQEVVKKCVKLDEELHQLKLDYKICEEAKSLVSQQLIDTRDALSEIERIAGANN